MIDNPTRILFDHIPKCGGTTIVNYLYHHYADEQRFQIDGGNSMESCSEFKVMSKEARFSKRLVMGHDANTLLDHVHPETIAITVVREPIDRIISHYYFAKQNPEHYLYRQIHSERLSLKDYVCKPITAETTNWYTSHFTNLSVTEVLCCPALAICKAMEYIRDTYVVLGFQDTLPQFVATLQSLTNLEYYFENERFNTTVGRCDRQTLAAEIIEGVSEHNSVDLELFELLKKEYPVQETKLATLVNYEDYSARANK